MIEQRKKRESDEKEEKKKRKQSVQGMKEQGLVELSMEK